MSDKMQKKVKRRESYDGVSKEIDKLNKTESSKMTKKDWISFAVIMVLVILFTFLNFGSGKAPTTWYQNESEESFIIYELPENSKPGDLYLYLGITETNYTPLKIYTSDTYTTNSNNWTFKKSYNIDNANMYRFYNAYSFDGKDVSYIIIKFEKKLVRVNEIVLTNYNTKTPIELKVAYSRENTEYFAENTLDEQDIFDGGATNFNGMYFDEVYHARTAFEFINGWDVYEWTHPPLGKLIISLGILVFGMNPFGWRIMSALFSIASVALMYFLGKKIFKKTTFAALIAGFFAAEGLRFTLGRIATVDSFLVFFILLSFYFMYDYFSKGIDYKHIFKSLVPFALSGIFFGLAFCTKWNGAYAGLGLLILFIIAFVRMCVSYAKSKEAVKDGEYTADDKLAVKKFPLAVVMTVLFGLIFFIAIPFVAYVAEFAIFKRCGAEGTLWEIFIANQKRIWEYHSTLNATHNSTSPWWSWIFNGRSVYFAYSDSYFGSSVYSRVHCMMTTSTSVFGIWAIVYFVIYLIKYLSHKKKQTLSADEVALMRKIKNPLIFLFVGLLANWIPWAFVSRLAFIYHFYASSAFLVGLIVLFLYTKCIVENEIVYSGEMALLNGKKRDLSRGAVKIIIFACVTVLNFLFFLPVFTGLPVGSAVGVFLFGWANGFWGYGLFPSI